jgi:hypothetical protein
MKQTEKGQSKAPSQRQLRVAEEIRHIIAKMLSQDDLFIEGLKMSFADLKPIYVNSWEEAHNFLKQEEVKNYLITLREIKE